MTKLAIALDKPLANILLLPRFYDMVGERTRRTRGTLAKLEKLAGHMREVFS